MSRRRSSSFADHLDSPDMAVAVLAGAAALLVALAVLGLVDMDDTRQREPLPPPPVYVTRPTVAP